MPTMDWLLTLIRYFNKFQKYEPDPKYSDVKKQHTGPARVGYFGHFADFSRDFVQACAKVGVPLSPDFNTDAGTRGVNQVSTTYFSIILFWQWIRRSVCIDKAANCLNASDFAQWHTSTNTKLASLLRRHTSPKTFWPDPIWQLRLTLQLLEFYLNRRKTVMKLGLLASSLRDPREAPDTRLGLRKKLSFGMFPVHFCCPTLIYRVY